MAAVAALVAVVEQADVPVRAERVEKAQQRAGSLRKVEAQQALVFRHALPLRATRRGAADEVAHMHFGQFVVGQVEHAVACALESLRHFLRILAAVDRQADEHMRFFRPLDAIGEFGHIARAHQSAQAAKAARLFGNGHGKQRLARLAHFSALGDKAQAVEIHVRPAGHGHEGLALELVPRAIGLDGRDRHRARGFQHAASVFEHVLDCGAHRVGIDHHEVVHQIAHQAEGLAPDLLHRSAVAKQPHFRQRDPTARLHAAQHGVGIDRLHPDHLDLRPHRLDVSGHPRDQPAAADGAKHRMNRRLVLAQNFHADGALARDHVRVVEGVDESQPLLVLQRERVGVSVAIAVALQHHVHAGAAKSAHRVDFHLRRGGGHHDHRAATQPVRRQRHALRVIARRRANHAALALGLGQSRHLVVRPAQLEAEHRLRVLALEQHLVMQAARQIARRLQRRFNRHVIHPCVQNTLQIVGMLRGHLDLPIAKEPIL